MSMNFCKNFAVLRRTHGYTQESIAEKCGVSRQAIAKWEAGTSLPDMYKLVDIAKLFDVSIDDLVCGNHFCEIDTLPTVDEKLESIISRLDKIEGKLPEDSDAADDLYQYYLDTLAYPDDSELEEWALILGSIIEIIEEYQKSGYEKAWDIIVQLIVLERGTFSEVLSHLYDLSSVLYEEYSPIGAEKNTQYLDFIEDVANIMPAWSKILKHEIMLERQKPNRFADWNR